MNKKKEILTISFSLPKDMAKKFMKISKDINKPVVEIFKEHFGLKSWEGIDFRLSKHDKLIIPIVWNMFNELSLLTSAMSQNIENCPAHKKTIYKQILAMFKSCYAIINTIIDYYEKGTGNKLSDEEQEMASDFSTLMSQIHLSIIENPKLIKQFIKILKEEFKIEYQE